MAVYKVQLMRDEKVDGEAQSVKAGSEKAAAESLFGNVLFRQGPAARVRVLVQAPGGAGSPTLFYER